MRRGIALWPLIGILACGALAWNGSRFLETKPKPRSKDLSFLPAPVVAKALACGQPTALAKLRWIDSFAYFNRQIDRRDDSVAGADQRGGFERLYDTLIALDPRFLPFYEHAVLNMSGVLKQHRAGLSMLMRGLIARPQETSLWRLASAELAISFDLAKRDPAQLDHWLRAWMDAESADDARQAVLDWRRGLAFANVDGLQTLPYWLEQLRSTKPGSPLAIFVEGTIRELLAEHGSRELAKVLYPSLLPLITNAHLDPMAVVARWPRGAPTWAPVVWSGPGGPAPVLRPDPFGYDWQRGVDRVISPGREQRRFLVTSQSQRLALEAEAAKRGRPPADAAEASAWGISLPQPGYGGTWSFAGALPEVQWPEPPRQPWPLR
jgi:hypothetical protein